MSALKPVTPPWPDPMPIPDEPLRIAMIGAGQRARNTYLPHLPSLAPFLKVVAVCDPVRESADAGAKALSAKPYYDIHDLVADRPMEACIAVTGAAFQYAINMFLIDHGIPCHTETPWGTMLCQTREMVEAARRGNVIVRVGENFIRTPIDRFAQTVQANGYLGCIGRIMCYADHGGYHNNSRWIRFAGCHPDWMQCIEHRMDIMPVHRINTRADSEAYHARFYHFPNDFMVNDISVGLGKGALGRHARPGYTEWHGERGTMIHRATTPYWAESEAELRRVAAPGQNAAEAPHPDAFASQLTPVTIQLRDMEWSTVEAWTPEGHIEYVNPFCDYLMHHPRREPIMGQSHKERTAIADHVVDFVLAVKGLRDSEFTPEDGLAAQMMTVGAHESALHDGQRIELPIEGDVEVDAIQRQQQTEALGADPMDIEAMLAVPKAKR